eukprot:EG_transcript_42496
MSPSRLSSGSPAPGGEAAQKPPTHFLNNFSLSPHKSLNRRHSVAPPPVPPLHCPPMRSRRRASAGDLEMPMQTAASLRRRGSASPKAAVPVRPPSIPIDAGAVDPLRGSPGEGGAGTPRRPPSPATKSP